MNSNIILGATGGVTLSSVVTLSRVDKESAIYDNLFQGKIIIVIKTYSHQRAFCQHCVGCRWGAGPNVGPPTDRRPRRFLTRISGLERCCY